MQSKRVHWFENDVRFLLKLWKRHISELRLNKRNKHVYDVMASKMHGNDMNFTAEEIRTKIKNLTKRFRSEQKILAAGKTMEEWQFFTPIDNVLNHFGSRHRVTKVQSPVPDKNENEYTDEDNDEEMVYPLDVEIKSEPAGSVSIASDPERNDDPGPSIDRTEVDTPTSMFDQVPASNNLHQHNNHHQQQHHHNRQLNDVHEEILDEMRRANRVAAENQRETNRLLQQTNDIAEQHLAMYRDFFDFMKNKFK